MKTRFSIIVLLASMLSTQAIAKGIRLHLSNDNFSTSTYVVFSGNATTGFDRKTDKEMKASENKINYIYSTDSKERRMYVNYCPAPVSCLSIPVAIDAVQSGAFSLELTDEDGDLQNLAFTLTDLSTMSVVKLTPGLASTLTIAGADEGTRKQYMLNVFPAPSISSTPVSCAYSKNGSIHVNFNAGGEWKVNLRTPLGLVASLPSLNEDALFDELAPGVYFVEGWKNDVRIWEEIVPVRRPQPIRPKFALSADTLTAGQLLSTENRSSGGSHFYWEFGDESSSAGFTPSHTFRTPGVYTVRLTVADAAGCISTDQKTVLVEPAGRDIASAEEADTYSK